MSGHLDYAWATNELLDNIINNEDLYLVFSSTVWSADQIDNWFFNHGFPAGVLRDEVDFEAVADFIEEGL